MARRREVGTWVPRLSAMSAFGGLLRAGHPEPSLVVTVVAVGLGVGVGLSPRRLVVLGVAVLAGQLSVGWSNDLLDARRGLDRGRTDKPLAVGSASEIGVQRAAAIALGLAVAFSLMLGPLPGVLHLAAVASAWAYNLWLKDTAASVVPYVLSFAALPVVVTTAAGEGPPRLWAVVAAACFGAGVHLSNALPDIAADREAGVRGLPQRLGERGAAAGAAGLLAVGAAAALVGPFLPGGGLPWPAVVGLAAAASGLGFSLVAARRGRLVVAYQLTVAVGLLVVAALVAAGGRMV